MPQKAPTPKPGAKDIPTPKPKAGAAAPPPVQQKKRKSRPHHDDDDSSVDSHGNIRDLIAYESDGESSSDAPPPKTKKTPKSAPPALPPRRKAAIKAQKRIKKKAPLVEESEDDEDDDYVVPYEDEDEDEDADDEEDEEDTTSDESEDSTEDSESTDSDESESDTKAKKFSSGGGAMQLLISDLADVISGPSKPKKYKLKNESIAVRQFVKLVQSEVEPDEEDIDRAITFFKGLAPAAQEKILTKLRNKIDPTEQTVPLRFQIMMKEVPSEIERVALAKYQAMMNIDPSSTEYYKASQWINGYTQLPLGVYRDLPVKLDDGAEACQQFVAKVRSQMESAIYGHDEAKLQILQFVSSWIANPKAAGNVLSIYGPPGVGKTTLIKDGVAKALDRPFHFITLGGATDASYLDGHSYTYEGSTWGRIADLLMKSKCMNPVIYFDELDKVSETPKGEEINNLLIHLTDGSQNDRFQDKYFTGIDLNLSRCLFIFSHNAHDKINPILRDRMYNIAVDGFNMKEKLVIAEQYLVPAALKEVGLHEKVGFSKDVMRHIIEHYTGEEKGVRELKRCIQTVVSKLNLLRFYNDPARVPFAIKGFSLPFTITTDHIEVLLKRRQKMDPSLSHMYT